MSAVYTASISGFCRSTGVFDALKELRQAGFDGVDFPLYYYARRKDSPLCDDSWWRIWTESVAVFAAEQQLPVTQAHAPWTQTLAADLHYEQPLPIYARIFEACSILGCKKLVFHPLPYPFRIVSADTLAVIHTLNLRWFRALLCDAEKYGITIELENTFDYFHLRMPSDPQLPHITAEQMCALADELNSPLVKICLDTGHANIAGENLPQMIETFGSRLDCLHLNDNFGKRSGQNEDLHLFPGEGTVDWQQVSAALKRSGYSGTYNLEIIADLAELSSASRAEKLVRGRQTAEVLFASK